MGVYRILSKRVKRVFSRDIESVLKIGCGGRFEKLRFDFCLGFVCDKSKMVGFFYYDKDEKYRNFLEYKVKG